MEECKFSSASAASTSTSLSFRDQVSFYNAQLPSWAPQLPPELVVQCLQWFAKTRALKQWQPIIDPFLKDEQDTHDQTMAKIVEHVREQQQQQQQGPWTCPTCTYENQAQAEHCEMCGCNQPLPSLEIPLPSHLAPEPLPELVLPAFVEVTVDEFYRWHAKFSADDDETFIGLINKRAEKGDKIRDSGAIPYLTEEERVLFPTLTRFSDQDLMFRDVMMQNINQHYSDIAFSSTFPPHHPRFPTTPVFCYSASSSSSASDHTLIRSVLSHPHVRNLFITPQKTATWNFLLEQTAIPGQKAFQLVLDTMAASKLSQSGGTDWKFDTSVFGQAFRQLELDDYAFNNAHGNEPNPTRFLVPANSRGWRTLMLGLNAADAGGPYREVLHLMCQELQSGVLPLFLLTPNSRYELGNNRNHFVPNPSATSTQHRQMYRFVGRLLGLVIRTQDVLQLDWPSLVWKCLKGDEIVEEDVMGVDRLSFALLQAMQKLEQQVECGVVAKEQFEELLDCKFAVIGSDSKVHPLTANGENVAVTWENRHVFSKALIQYRKNEFALQIDAMREGLADTVPLGFLSFFTWQELELQVCGRRTVDLELLKSVTRSGGVPEKLLAYFWNVMEKRFDDKQRGMFLQFVWGRSRLPLTRDAFSHPFTIKLLRVAPPTSPDAFLPVSQTCFFMLDLPNYSSEEVLYQRLLYAINNCESIDADRTNAANELAFLR